LIRSPHVVTLIHQDRFSPAAESLGTRREAFRGIFAALLLVLLAGCVEGPTEIQIRAGSLGPFDRGDPCDFERGCPRDPRRPTDPCHPDGEPDGGRTIELEPRR
jgi:hypothetical protein